MKKILIEDMIDICNIMYNKIEDGYESVCFVGMSYLSKVDLRVSSSTYDTEFDRFFETFARNETTFVAIGPFTTETIADIVAKYADRSEL